MQQIKRDRYLKRLISRRENGMIKVITGIRRCGKTYLLFTLYADYLRKTGVKEDHIIAVSLDDTRWAALRDPEALNAYLLEQIGRSDSTASSAPAATSAAAAAPNPNTYYIFIDEIQYAITPAELAGSEAPRIYGVLNGLLHHRNVDAYVTGSNSKLLSTDVMTEFRGRGDEVRVHPLSFAEFMQAYPADKYAGYSDYSIFGGMPLVASMKSEEQKTRYLQNLFSEVYVKDIIARYRLEKSIELDTLVDVLASVDASLVSVSKIANTFASNLQMNVSPNTLAKYIDCLRDAFLINEARRYDIKGRKYIGAPKKFYFEDTGLRNARLGFRQNEPTHLMENIVYNELVARGFSVDVGTLNTREKQAGRDVRKQREVDFVANLGSRRLYIQSAYALPDEEKIAQEKAALRNIDDSFEKIIITANITRPWHDNDGIRTMSIYDFLLDETLVPSNY